MEHGKRSTYNNYKCRCDACSTANREYNRKRTGFNQAARFTKIETMLTDILKRLPVTIDTENKP